MTSLRDRYHLPVGVIAGLPELVAFIQEDNRRFMAGMRRVSPGILVELIQKYDPILAELLESLEPAAPGLGVAWAGEEVSQNWFDVAREYTEKWHHQQQLRDATGRAPLYGPELLVPVLETFARGLPFAYRTHGSPDKTVISVVVTGSVSLAWTLRRGQAGWSLFACADPAASTTIEVSADLAWRIWTKSVSREVALRGIHVAGDPADAAPLIDFVAIMA